LDNLDIGEFVEFFQNLANHVLPPEQGGHIDFFVPLASSGLFCRLSFVNKNDDEQLEQLAL
jgi:hypothetical protein